MRRIAAHVTAKVVSLPLAAALLGLIGCNEREPSTTFQRKTVAPPSTDETVYSIDTGTGGRSDTERGSGDPLRYAYYGLPLTAPLEPEYLQLFNDAYVVGYDFARRDPAWTCYRLFDTDRKPSEAERKRDGRAAAAEDQRVAQAAPEPAAGTNSGGNSGGKKQSPQEQEHAQGATRRELVPALAIDACYGDDAAAQARLSSNTVPAPQQGNGEWDQLTALESAYAHAYGEIWVMSGPLFGEGAKTLATGAAMPDGFWKVQITVQDGRTRAQAFIIPAAAPTERGKDHPDLASRLVTVDEVQVRTGLTFLSDFHDVDDVEARRLILTRLPDGLWPTEAAPAKAPASLKTATAKLAQ